MGLPRFIEGRKYWFQNYWEHWKLLHTKASGLKPMIVRIGLLLAIGLIRRFVPLAETYLQTEESRMAMCYGLKDSDFGLLLIQCMRGTETMLTFGSRLQRKNPRLVGHNDLSGLFVTQVKYRLGIDSMVMHGISDIFPKYRERKLKTWKDQNTGIR